MRKVSDEFLATDIRLEEELRRANERMNLAVRGSNVGVWDIELPDGDYQRRRRHYVNVWEQLGYDGPPDGRDSALDVADPDERAQFEQALRRYLAGETPEFETEIRLRHKDGSYRTMLTRGAAVRDAAGKPTRMAGVVIDVTDLKRAEEEIGRLNRELRSRVDEMQAILDIVPIGIAIAHDPECRRITHNPYLSEVTGVPLGENASFDAPRAEQPTNHRIYQDGKELPPEQMPMQIACAGVEVRDYEMDIVRTDGGGSRKLLCYVRPLRDAEGRIRGSVGGYLDITARRQMEEALRHSEERFRGTFENAAVGIAHVDAGGRFLRVNEKYCAIVGHPREELFQRTYQDITHPDDLAASIAAARALFRGESPNFELEKRFVRKDGSLVWAQVFVSLQRDAAGAPSYNIGIIHDISERKRLEAELRTSEERRRLILDNATDAFVAMSADGLITEWNRHAESTFGWSRAEAVGRALSETIIPPQLREAHSRGLAHFLATSEGPVLNRVMEVAALRRDGREFPAEISIASVRLGEQYLFAAFMRDVTERKRAEEELRRAKETAEAANRAKDEFLANVSHEIRTPMNAILGMTELVLETPLADDQRQCLGTVKSAADNLLGIINDLLDFAKIEAGRLELELGDFSLRSAVGITLRALAARAHHKGLEVVCNVQPDVPDALIGDAGRLRQVLLNLVGNAIKFTEKGEVVVQVEAEPVAEPASRKEVVLRFSVHDTGISIPVDKQATIFRPFEQADTSTTRKYGGTGLGLTIAARLVALMGGQISVDSTPGQGSTFLFTARLGLQPQPTEPTAAPPPALLRNLPVLIIDDNATNRQILWEWLRGWQMDPAAAGDGVAAMDALWEAAARGRPYALVLLDARMPDTDGLALAAQIRKRAELSATRIILLSSGDRPGDWDRIRQLRIDAHLLKPIQQDELLDRIYQVMSRARGEEPTEAWPAAGQELPAEPAPATTRLHILLAEDDEFSARYMEELLARGGHCVRWTTNGREALSLAEEGVFDVLLLDIHMPEVDGFGVVGAIRERERAAGGRLPVIALTARSRKEDRERCLAAGMDDFLTKPVAAAALFAALHRLAPAPRVSRPYQADPGERGTLLDPVAVLTACGGDEEGLRRMCQDFQVYAPARLAEVGDALRDRDAPRLRQAAHKFCPLLLAFSTVAGNAASDLEDHAAQSQFKEARPLVERLETMTQELMRQVGNLSLETLRQQAEATDALKIGRHSKTDG